MIDFNPIEQNEISRAAVRYKKYGALSLYDDTKKYFPHIIERTKERLPNLIELGLIKTCPVEQTPTYWILTEKGEAFVMALAAMHTQEELEDMILQAFERWEGSKT